MNWLNGGLDMRQISIDCLILRAKESPMKETACSTFGREARTCLHVLQRSFTQHAVAAGRSWAGPLGPAEIKH